MHRTVKTAKSILVTEIILKNIIITVVAMSFGRTVNTGKSLIYYFFKNNLYV